MADRSDAAVESILIDVDNQPSSKFARTGISERDHVAEFPGRVDMQQRKRQLRRVEGFQRKMQKDRRVLADGIKKHRVVAFGNGLTNDMDAFRFELLEMRERRRCTIQ